MLRGACGLVPVLCCLWLSGCSSNDDQAGTPQSADAGQSQDATAPDVAADTIDAPIQVDAGDSGSAQDGDATAEAEPPQDASEEASAEAGHDAIAEGGDAPTTDAIEDAKPEVADVDAAIPDADAEAGLDAPPFCQPGETRCDGSTLELCNDDQSGFEPVVDCSPWACNEPAGQCEVCAAGGTTCGDETTRRICSADGLSFDDTPCPSAAPYCVDAGECVSCRDEGDCQQPAGECEQALCSVGTCSVVPVDAGTLCGSGGVCNGTGDCGECVPGESRCDGAQVQQCSAEGSWVPEQPCPYVCSQGACTGECVPGTRQCVGQTPRACDATGTWVAEASCSGGLPECFGGECVHATPPSCQALATDCGADADERCCEAVTVPGGTFCRSYDGVTFTDPDYGAEVSPFSLDVFEVTVGRFRAFLEAGGGTRAAPPQPGDGAHPGIADSGWNAEWDDELESDTAALRQALDCSATLSTWTDVPGGNEQRPVNCVTWFEAFAFCAWDGGRLPTEAEWNFVAAGGDEQRVYPWSSPPDAADISPDNASYWEDGTMQCAGDGQPGCTLEDIVRVGLKSPGAGRWGHDSLAGNVWEWVLDAYANPYPLAPCCDCASMGDPGDDRVLRGGSFFGNRSTLYASTRNPATPATRYYTVGLRCARQVP